jgi:hypothetical protein
MKMNMKFRKNEKAFVVASLVLFFLLAIFLFIDVSRKFEILANNRQRIGTLLFAYNDVRRGDASGISWEGLRRGSPVMKSDTIITGFDSSAGVAMSDGTLVDMCQDSVMTFEQSGDGVKAVIEKGCADVKRSGEGIAKDKKLVIMAENNKIAVKEGELTIAKPTGRAPEIFVRRGKASVFANGGERLLDAAELALLKPDALYVEKKMVALIDPSENRRYFTDRKEAHIEFAWEYRGRGDKRRVFLVEISKNRAFSPAHKKIESSDEMVSSNMPEGDYFWRVSAVDRETGTRETSGTGRFSVSRDDSFALLGPPDGEMVKYKDAPPMVVFTWEPHRLAESYILEVSERSDFSVLLKRIESRVVNFSYQWERRLEPGEGKTLYWRVTAAGGPRGWPGRRSDSRRFMVKRIDRLNQPLLVYPINGKSMSRSRIDKEHCIFSWEKTEDNVNKRILFSKEENFGPVYRMFPVDRDHWKMEKSFPSGRYFWLVGLYDKSGMMKAVSDTWMFELRDYEDLALVSPKDGSDFAIDDVRKAGLNFNWKNPELPGRFVLELAGDRDFNNIKRSITTESVKTTIDRVPPGSYYWRVRLMKDDNTVAAASETRSLTIREGAPPPDVIFPRAGGAVKMLTENELKFSWKPTRWANAYQLELHQLVKEKGKTKDMLVLSTQTKDPSYTVTDLSLLDVGNFYWTLRAMKKDRNNKVIRSSGKARNNFNINLGDSKIIIVSPEIQVIENE